MIGAGTVLGALWLGSSNPTRTLVLTDLSLFVGFLTVLYKSPSYLIDKESKSGPIVYFFGGAMIATMVSSTWLLTKQWHNPRLGSLTLEFLLFIASLHISTKFIKDDC